MENIPLLRDMVILLGISVPLSIILTRIGLPTVVGFLITGVIIGPSGLGLVTEMVIVETLAQIGIVLLLFTIGLEFSVKRMFKIKHEAMLGGGLQLGVTILCVFFLSRFFGLSLQVSILLGFIVGLSSSAIVLKLLGDRGEVDSQHGNLSIGILLFQDISLVVMVIVLQSFATGQTLTAAAVGQKLAVAAGAILLIVVSVAYLIPKLFHEVVRLRNREVLILTTVLVCIGTAWLTSLAGLSLAIGAFIAGLVISDSEYSNQLTVEVLPFRDTFGALFFISIGMLLEFSYFVSHLPVVLGLTLGVLLLKMIIIIGVGRILRYPVRLAFIVGFNLAQIGEFSFILIKMGEEHSILPHDLYQLVLAVSILTMAATPFMFRISPSAATFLAGIFGGGAIKGPEEEETVPGVSNHVIIIGYGLNGKNLANVLKKTGIEHVIMDVNADRIKKAQKDGHKAYFGDACHPAVLGHMGVEKAKMLVIGITDPVGTRQMVKTARQLNPGIAIVVRTRLIDDVEELYQLGATQVIPEEFETSVEIFARVLKAYGIPGNVIQNQIDLVRHEGYAMFRSQSLSVERLADLTRILETSVMDTHYVEEGSDIEGKTLNDINIRKLTGAGVMAIIRKGQAHTNPRGDFVVLAGDMLVILGSHAELNAAMILLKATCII